MLTPGCDRCGQCGCSCGTLPYTLTVTLSGLKNRTHSEHCRLKFSSPFGCGAAGVALDPGGCLDDEPECGESTVGPLTKIVLTEPGHGYARVGYKQPVISISGGSGTGATFTPTLEAVDGTLDEQCRTYKIKSVDVDGGAGYVDNETLAVTADGDVVAKAVVTVRTGVVREEPVLTADVSGVDAESLAVTLASNGDDPETWGIASVSVSAAGIGWNSGEWTLPVTFSTTGVTVSAASAIATKEVISPGAEYTFTSGGGTGFSATVTLAEQTCDDGYPCYSPTSISITSGGTGYAVDDVIEFLAINRDIANGIEGVANYTVLSVGGSGNVLSLSGPDVPEPFRKFTGGIDSVTISNPGKYYALVDDGVPIGVDVTTPGEYATEDPTADVCVANVNVTIDRQSGSLCDSPNELSVSAEVAGVTGESLEVTLGFDNDSPAIWYVKSVSVGAAGTGWEPDGPSPGSWTLPVTFSANETTDITQTPPSANAVREVVNPGTQLLDENDGGLNATLSLKQITHDDGYPAWIPDAVSILSGGTGYSVDDAVQFVPLEYGDAGVYGAAYYTVSSVDENGAVGGLQQASAPEIFRKFTGGIGSVVVADRGEYISTKLAAIRAVIDSDLTSPTFSQITDVVIENEGGDDYLVWHWICTNQEQMNDVPIVLTAVNPKRLVTLAVNSCFGTDACVRVVPVGDDITCEEEPLTRAAAYSGQPSPINKIELVSGGYGYAKLGRKVPAWTVSQSGWTFTPTFTEQQTNWCGLPYWAVSSFSISGSGTPVESGTPLTISVAGDDKVDEHAVATIVASGGTPQSVTVTRGGQYYREDATLPALVANVSVDQLPPSAGAGAAVSLTVNKTPGDPQFGKIISAQIDKKGGGYTLLGSPFDCVYRSDPCPSSNAPRLEVVLRGGGKAPDVVLTDNRVIYESGGGNTTVLRASSVVADCNSFPSSASLLYGAPAGATASISLGGNVTTSCASPAWCVGCICPLDNVADLGATPVAFASECPCFAGSLSGAGTIADGIVTSCETESGAFVPVAVGVDCCEAICNDTGECVLDYKVCAGAYIYTEEDGLGSYIAIQGCVCTDELAVVDGELIGTVEVPLYTLANPPVLYCTGTVTFG